jgi:hypothetical protein
VVLAHLAALIVGAGLFFACFSAIFVGSWFLLLLFLCCYAVAGALLVRIGRVHPRTVTLLLVAPAIPWLLWLFPASIPEAGLLRALLWPLLVLVMAGLSWGGIAIGEKWKNSVNGE